MCNGSTPVHSATLLLETAPCDATYKTISHEEVRELINECEEAERIRDVSDETEIRDATEESSDSQFSANRIDAEETDILLQCLQKIVATEPEIAKYAKYIIDY